MLSSIFSSCDTRRLLTRIVAQRDRFPSLFCSVWQNAVTVSETPFVKLQTSFVHLSEYGVFEDSVPQLENRAPALDRDPAGHFTSWKIARSTSSSLATHLTGSSPTRQTGSSSGPTGTIMDNLINATTDRSYLSYPDMESGQRPRPVSADRSQHEEYAAMKKHQPKFVYACEFCGQIYYQRQHLTRHYSVHTGERLFKCSLCSMDFCLKNSLKLHIVNVHKKPTYDAELFIVTKKSLYGTRCSENTSWNYGD